MGCCSCKKHKNKIEGPGGGGKRKKSARNDLSSHNQQRQQPQQRMSQEIIEVSSSEFAAGRFLLKYNCVTDEYTRPFGVVENGAPAVITGWDSIAQKEGGVYRKVEQNWRAFLTTEGKSAKLSWHIKHPFGARIRRAEARMSGWATFRNGKIGAELVSGDKKDSIPLVCEPFLAEQQAEGVWGLNRESQIETLSVSDVGLADHTTLTIYLNDYETNAGFDHDLDDAQVFRTPLDAPNAENLVLEIEFDQITQ